MAVRALLIAAVLAAAACTTHAACKEGDPFDAQTGAKCPQKTAASASPNSINTRDGERQFASIDAMRACFFS